LFQLIAAHISTSVNIPATGSISFETQQLFDPISSIRISLAVAYDNLIGIAMPGSDIQKRINLSPNLCWSRPI